MLALACGRTRMHFGAHVYPHPEGRPALPCKQPNGKRRPQADNGQETIIHTSHSPAAACTHTHTHTHTHTQKHTRILAQPRAHTYTHTQTHIQEHARVLAHPRAHTRTTHTYTYTYMRGHNPKAPPISRAHRRRLPGSSSWRPRTATWSSTKRRARSR